MVIHKNMERQHLSLFGPWGDAIFVGEPPGDNLDFWAEGGDLALPNSHLTLRYSNGFHKYSTADYTSLKPYFAQLSVNSSEPSVPISLSMPDYLASRDPVIRYILSPSLQSTRKQTSSTGRTNRAGSRTKTAKY